LAEVEGGEWIGRAKFFAFCSKAMRRILIDYARERGAEKWRRLGGEREWSASRDDEGDAERDRPHRALPSPSQMAASTLTNSAGRSMAGSSPARSIT
jgi:hypothetical protein